MSTRIFAAVLGMGAAMCLAAPVEAARIDNGPVASLYENDGRKKVSRKYSKQRSSYGRTSKSRRSSGNYRKKANRSSGKKRVAARAMTAGRSGGVALRAPASRLPRGGCLLASRVSSVRFRWFPRAARAPRSATPGARRAMPRAMRSTSTRVAANRRSSRGCAPITIRVEP